MAALLFNPYLRAKPPSAFVSMKRPYSEQRQTLPQVVVLAPRLVITVPVAEQIGEDHDVSNGATRFASSGEQMLLCGQGGLLERGLQAASLCV